MLMKVKEMQARFADLDPEAEVSVKVTTMDDIRKVAYLIGVDCEFSDSEIHQILSNTDMTSAIDDIRHEIEDFIEYKEDNDEDEE